MKDFDKNFIYDFEVSKFIIDLIQYASDEDVGILINNIHRRMREMFTFDITNDDNFNLTNKEILIRTILNHNNYTKGILFHLAHLAGCLYSYNFGTNSNTKMKREKLLQKAQDYNELEFSGESYLAKTDKGIKKVNIEKYNNIYNLDPGELREILHILITSYTKYNFYYCFDDNNLYKVSLEESLTDEIFDITHKRNSTHLYSELTGQTFVIPYAMKLDKLQSIKYFCNIHSSICEVLNYKLEPCNWCNPVKGNKKKCNNCTILYDDLKNIKSSVDLKKELKALKNEKNKNLAEYRNSIKKVFENYINGANVNNKDKFALKKLIDNSIFPVVNVNKCKI